MRGNGSSPGGRADRQRVIRQLVAGMAIASQGDLAEQLGRHGFSVTQATVSRDIAELGLVKVSRGERHVYVAPEDVSVRSLPTDERLRRILADIPVTIGRSGLILLIIGTPGTASTIAQAIDDSSLTDQEGTLAGDNTLLVLFADETRLERWLDRFRTIQALAAPIGTAGASPGSSIPTPSSEALA
jgi:transcriptional regulator of arginine metabolism